MLQHVPASRDGLQRRQAAALHTSGASTAAFQESDTTQKANHVYIYDPAAIHSGQVRVPDWVTQGQTTTIAGPFVNESGGGDLPKGDEVFIITVNDRNMRHTNQ